MNLEELLLETTPKREEVKEDIKESNTSSKQTIPDVSNGEFSLAPFRVGKSHNEDGSPFVDYEDLAKDSSKMEFGTNFYRHKQKVTLDLENANNPHMLLTGESGSGKTTFAKSVIYWLGETKIVIVLDLKGDMHVKKERVFKFTGRKSEYSVSLFQFDPDPINGGIDENIVSITELINKYDLKGKMGLYQLGIMSDILTDLYNLKGFYEDDESTWTRGWDLNNEEDKKKWLGSLPTIDELYDYLEYLDTCLNNEDDMDLGISVFKTAKKISTLYKKGDKQSTEQAEKLFKKSINKYEKYFLNVIGNKDFLYSQMEKDENENEKDEKNPYDSCNIQKYQNKRAANVIETMKFVVKKLQKSKVFGSKIPDIQFGVNRFDLSGLNINLQNFIVEILINRVFKELSFRGEYSKLPLEYRQKHGKSFDRVLVIDECQRIMPTGREANDAKTGINQIGQESRSRGLALMLLTQTPNHVTYSLLNNIGTKIVFQTAKNDVKAAACAMGVETNNFNILRRYRGICLFNSRGSISTTALRWIQENKVIQ